MQERIKAIITASWTVAVNQTEKNIREIFDANTNLSQHGTLFSYLCLIEHADYLSSILNLHSR